MKHSDLNRLMDEFLDMLSHVQTRAAKRMHLKVFSKKTGLKMADLWRRLQERKRSHKV